MRMENNYKGQEKEMVYNKTEEDLFH